MMPTPIPTEQARAFRRAICERLGLDPTFVSEGDFSVSIDSAEGLGSVSLTAFLPADEIVALFNTHHP